MQFLQRFGYKLKMHKRAIVDGSKCIFARKREREKERVFVADEPRGCTVGDMGWIYVCVRENHFVKGMCKVSKWCFSIVWFRVFSRILPSTIEHVYRIAIILRGSTLIRGMWERKRVAGRTTQNRNDDIVIGIPRILEVSPMLHELTERYLDADKICDKEVFRGESWIEESIAIEEKSPACPVRTG